jgi:sterol desaturase/sphingolipid hydroxylase (fatty acid hydroxylase superfamily)
MLLVGALLWMPLGWWVAGPRAGIVLALGWAVGYFAYEYQHASAHLRAPRNRYEAFVRRHHFHHHFGAPMANHGVSVAVWDKVFGTFQRPERVRVPRRLALPWMLDDRGELRPGFTDDYQLVGEATPTERLLQLDRARAFASVAPAD